MEVHLPTGYQCVHSFKRSYVRWMMHSGIYPSRLGGGVVLEYIGGSGDGGGPLLEDPKWPPLEFSLSLTSCLYFCQPSWIFRSKTHCRAIHDKHTGQAAMRNNGEGYIQAKDCWPVLIWGELSSYPRLYLLFIYFWGFFSATKTILLVSSSSFYILCKQKQDLISIRYEQSLQTKN